MNTDYEVRISQLKALYQSGQISYKEFRKMGEEIVDEMNVKGAEIAKKHHMRYKKLTFGYIFR